MYEYHLPWPLSTILVIQQSKNYQKKYYKICAEANFTGKGGIMSYMTYLSLYHYIFKIVLFQIMLNILYIFLISIIFWYKYDSI